MNVAQLKRFVADSAGRVVTGFHVRMNVAQLKRHPLSFSQLADSRFPRSNERGSIEARRPPLKVSHGSFGFHVRMNVAQLKPARSSILPVGGKCFHVRMNVAQLKPTIRMPPHIPFVGFPRSNERGSIEAMQLSPKYYSACEVSTFE